MTTPEVVFIIISAIGGITFVTFVGACIGNPFPRKVRR